MTPSNESIKIAKNIMMPHWPCFTPENFERVWAGIALALDSARRAPEGHIIDDKGEVLVKCRTINGSFCKPDEWAIVVTRQAAEKARTA